MDRIKKLNGSMIAAIVLSVLLIMSVTAGATLAWFASRDSATASLTMGEAVVVTIGEDYKQGDGSLTMALPVPDGEGMLPGMSVTPNIKVQLQRSSTNALLRARFITTVEYPDKYEDAAYTDRTKYPNATGYTEPADGVVTVPGRVLDAATFPDDHVYSGKITYTYYDYTGAVSSTKTINLVRVKVRQALVDALNKAGTDDSADGEDYTSGNWTINGIATVVTAQNIAELEVRQRGVDLTDAINRVLAGQRGYGINPETGEIENDSAFAVKYTRRVADGWAYRNADQAWYYLGSSTNGFVLDNQTGTDEAVTATQVARDITAYADAPVGNITVKRPTYKLVGEEGNPYKTTTNDRGKDQTRNYLGGTADDNSMDVVANEKAVLTQKTMASIDLSQGNVSIDFLTKRFVLPTFINNDYAQAKVTFNFTVEAVQDYLIDPLQEATSAADRVPNNLVNAIMVFNNAFPQGLVADASTSLAATGVVTNIIPGGGTSVVWNQEEGIATVKFGTQNLTDAGLTEGGLYSYGYLTDGSVTGTGIKGFGTQEDDYGDVVADYTKTKAWQRGTASSIGVTPYTTSEQTPQPPQP